jgi:hypothetical protein
MKFFMRHAPSVTIRREAWILISCLTIVTSFTACVSAPNSGGVNPQLPVGVVLSTTPINNQPTFLGVSPRLKNREDEHAVLVQSAAIQAARYIRLSGEATLYSRRTARGTGYIHSISIDDDYALAAELESSLEPAGIHAFENGSFGRFVLTGFPSIAIGYSVPSGVRAPRWRTAVPGIDGHFVGVGFAARKRLLVDTIENADREALYAILAEIAVEVQSERFEVVSSGSVSQSGGTNLERAKGEITGFYILDRWIDENGSVYSLAVCPRIENLD